MLAYIPAVFLLSDPQVSCAHSGLFANLLHPNHYIMIVIALLAALPFSTAHAMAAPQYKEIQLRQITQVPGSAATTVDPAAVATSNFATSNLADITQCIPPSSLFASIPTDVPSFPADLESVFATIDANHPSISRVHGKMSQEGGAVFPIHVRDGRSKPEN